MLENSQSFNNIRILTLGESGVGKTTLILNYINPDIKNNNLEKKNPTIGVDYQKKLITLDNTNINVEIWDTAGQEKFKNITRQYYNGANGVILVFDISDKQSFEKINLWIKDLSDRIDLNNICLILIGNKTDLDDKREISVEEAQNFAEENNFDYYEICAIKNIGITEMMEFFIKKCNDKMQQNDNESFSIINKNMNNYSNSNCC